MKLLQAGILGFSQRGFVWAEINLFRISRQGILGQLKDLIAAIKCIYSVPAKPQPQPVLKAEWSGRLF